MGFFVSLLFFFHCMRVCHLFLLNGSALVRCNDINIYFTQDIVRVSDSIRNGAKLRHVDYDGTTIDVNRSSAGANFSSSHSRHI